MLSVVFYLLVFAVVFVLQTVAMRMKNDKVKRIVVIFSFAIILCLIGFRYQVGTDYDAYIDMYDKYAGGTVEKNWARDGDIGTKLILGFLPNFFSDGKIIFWVYGFLALYPLYRINKNSNYKYLAYSTLVFNLIFLPICLNAIRQGAAMSFVLLAFSYIWDSPKILRSLLCIAVASMLHTSAILMLPFLLIYIYTKKYNKSFIIPAFVMTIFISIALNTFLKDLFVENDFYNDILVDGSGGLNANWFIVNIVYYLILLVFVFLMYKRGKIVSSENDKLIKNTFGIVLIGAIFNVTSSSMKYLFRISWYFSCFQIILIPVVLQNIANKNTRVISKIVCVALLITLFIYNYYVRGDHEIIPYKTWLFM